MTAIYLHDIWLSHTGFFVPSVIDIDCVNSRQLVDSVNTAFTADKPRRTDHKVHHAVIHLIFFSHSIVPCCFKSFVCFVMMIVQSSAECNMQTTAVL